MFYHLTRSAPEPTLTTLLQRTLDRGWRAAVRGRDDARMAALDAALWQGDGFLPHGLAGGPHDADQPVLLTTAATLPNAADCLIAIDGAPVTPAEVAACARVCVLFDGNDPAALELARGQWRSLSGAGEAAQYWSEESGKWQMKLERKA